MPGRPSKTEGMRGSTGGLAGNGSGMIGRKPKAVPNIHEFLQGSHVAVMLGPSEYSSGSAAEAAAAVPPPARLRRRLARLLLLWPEEPPVDRPPSAVTRPLCLGSARRRSRLHSRQATSLPHGMSHCPPCTAITRRS